MSWQDILLFTLSSDTRCIYFILSLFMTSFFTRPNTIHQSMFQSFRPTPSSHLFFKAIILLLSWSGAGLPSLHDTPNQPSRLFSPTSVTVFCLLMQSATLYIRPPFPAFAIDNLSFVSVHLFHKASSLYWGYCFSPIIKIEFLAIHYKCVLTRPISAESRDSLTILLFFSPCLSSSLHILFWALCSSSKGAHLPVMVLNYHSKWERR